MRGVIVTSKLVEELVAIHNIKNFFKVERVGWQTTCVDDDDFRCYVIDGIGCKHEWDGHTVRGTSELDALQKAKDWYVATFKEAV